jgi:hypothetical protein
MSREDEHMNNEPNYQKKYYMVKKENYYKDVTCDACGLTFKLYNKSHHMKTKKHLLIVEQKELAQKEKELIQKENDSMKKELEKLKNNI